MANLPSDFWGGWVAVLTIVSLIGPNGAGKTTFFNLLTGLYIPTSGTMTFAGENLAGRRPDEVVKLGIGRTFQNIRLFANMTVLENVLVGHHVRMKAGALGALFRPPSVRAEERRDHRIDHRSVEPFRPRPRFDGVPGEGRSRDERRQQRKRAGE